MQKRSFKTFTAAAMLFFFLATPIGVYAQFGSAQYTELLALQALTDPNATQTARLLALLALQEQQNQNQGQQQGGGGFGVGGLNPSMLGLAMMGGGRGSGGQGQGGLAKVGQTLATLGALSGNMGLAMVGMIMSMVGGLGGSTPQQGNVDEQYVGQGQSFGSGRGPNSNYGAYDPYYTAPTTPSTSVAQATACTSSIFIVKDTTVTPNITKPYPDATSVAKNGCILAINSDTVPHNVKVEVKKEGQTTVSANEAIAASSSHIFRFSAKNTYTVCVDSVATACTTVTVQ